MKKITFAIFTVILTVLHQSILFSQISNNPAKNPGNICTEEVTFYSDGLTIVGDMNYPEGAGPFPVIIFVHGSGPNKRYS